MWDTASDGDLQKIEILQCLLVICIPTIRLTNFEKQTTTQHELQQDFPLQQQQDQDSILYCLPCCRIEQSRLYIPLRPGPPRWRSGMPHTPQGGVQVLPQDWPHTQALP